jgi:hypothetical protein
MNHRPPPNPADYIARQPWYRPAAWCAAAAVILGTASVLCLALGAISVQQAIALAMPAAVFLVGGLIAAVSANTATAQRHGFEVGLRVGSALSRWRSVCWRTTARAKNGRG